MITFKLTSINIIKGKGETSIRLKRIEVAKKCQRRRIDYFLQEYVSNSRSGRMLLMHYTKT